tara:strand:- start:174 stop:284 length:111 start_codon:yes stop_codon:yes gene_type:complete
MKKTKHIIRVGFVPAFGSLPRLGKSKNMVLGELPRN